MCSVLARLRASTDGRPSPGSPARPRLHLPTCCPPPSSQRRRRAPVARGCVCQIVAHRRRPRAGAALPSPAAAATRLLPAAVGAAQASHSPRPRLRLPVCCPPPSPTRWRRAPFARSCHCASDGRRRRLRAGAALSTPSAASSRLLPFACVPALMPRSLRPRLPLRAWCAPPAPPLLTPHSPRPQFLCCRGPGFSDAGDQAGRMAEGEARVGGDGLVLDSATREALGLWRGGSTKRRRRTTACGPSLVACRSRRLTVCPEKGISIGRKIRRGIKTKPFVVIELLLHFTKHKAIHSRDADHCP